MRPCRRTEEPALLATHGPEIGRTFVERRREEPAYRWQWPRRDGQSLLEVVREALIAMTAAHCCYCDGYPLDATGQAQVDHFRPKGHFPELVCTWSNLFLICVACNHTKAERWDEGLLKPDDAEYRFGDFFEFDFETGALRPHGVVPEDVRRRAEVTIDVLELNRAGACSSRKRFWHQLREMPPEARADMPYRFLAELYDEVVSILVV